MTPSLALAGNPNAGKTSLFNELTGAHQHVGNWPGKTVERITGEFRSGGEVFSIVDLPGIYGLVAVSAEEELAVDHLIGGPDAVITVVDGVNLDRTLHLAVQIAELGLRQVVACNMSDVAQRRGMDIDYPVLGDALGADVIPTVARRGEGVGAVREAVADALGRGPAGPLVVDYGAVVERHLVVLMGQILGAPDVAAIAPARWTALQLLGGDQRLTDRLTGAAGGPGIVAAAAAAREEIEADTGLDAGVAIAERRYQWVRSVVAEATGGRGNRPAWPDRIDRVLTHRWLGIPVFLAVMWLILKITADVTAPFLDWVDSVVSGPVSHWTASGLAAVGLGGTWGEGLIVDGVLAGVGGVLVFVPVLFGLYLTLAVLEDTGYMARAALVMERAMRAIGIPGKAFLPMMVGFGCTVPAIYATRTLDTPRDRLLTGLLVPFMSCGARLPVFVLLSSIFFARSTGSVVFSMYLLGIAVAVLIGWLLGRTWLKEDDPVPMVMVIPDLRLPNARTVWTLVKRRTWAFIEGAGTLILAASIVVWVLLAIPVRGGSFGDTEVGDSVFAAVAKGASVAMEPLGFGDWEQGGALLTGFVAKEVVVSTLSQLYGNGGEDIEETTGGFVDDLKEIGSGFVSASIDTVLAVPGVVGLDFIEMEDETSPEIDHRIEASFDSASGGSGALAAVAFMVFVLLYTPCVAAVAAFRHEFGTRWMMVSVIGQLVIAWLGAFLVFQGGRLLGFG